MKRSILALLASMTALPLAGGCTRYFRVTEPGGGQVWYTKSISRTRTGGVQFRDLEQNAEVTLQSSVVKEIQKQDLPEGLAK